ncbi:hypothetical protein SUGI_0349000 [Cryptomeria japonica]|nr:hypothetical protein SUGI_0349000 [Cryptomeria japonica]
MVKENQRELRVVMFPWLAQGHIMPFVELAKSLANYGLKIFFVSTPLSIKLQMKPQISGDKLGSTVTHFESSFYRCIFNPLHVKFNDGRVKVWGATYNSSHAI